MITYVPQAHYHSGPMDSNLESLKKSFNILSLLPPTVSTTEECNGYINSSKNQEVANMLNQSSEKELVARKKFLSKESKKSLII